MSHFPIVYDWELRNERSELDWQALLEWMRGENIDANEVRSLVLVGENLAEVSYVARDRDGKLVPVTDDDGELVIGTRTETMQLSCMPPWLP